MSDGMQPHDSSAREQTMRQDVMLMAIAVAGLFNGMHFSPFLAIFAAGLAPIFSALFITSPVLLFYFSSLTLAVATVIIAGVPAALYERFSGRRESNMTSLTIWLLGALFLSIPAIHRFFTGQ